jgi:hypothetical protein
MHPVRSFPDFERSAGNCRRTFLCRETSDDDLNRSIEGSIAQASVMWLLHHGFEGVQDRGESLEQQIVRLSSAVFDAIGTGNPILRK